MRCSNPHVLLLLVAIVLKVTWTMPLENKVQPSGFKLSYRRQTDSLVGPILFNAREHQHLISGLDSHTQYEVQVQALGAEEAGGGTGANSIHTLAESGPEEEKSSVVEPPSGLEAESLSATSIRLIWHAPSEQISFYTVRYHPVQTAISINTSVSKFLRSTSLGVEVTDLKPFTVYEFQVRSHDATSNQGPYGNKVECQTLEDVPEQPWNLQIKVLNLTTVHASWKEPIIVNGLLGSFRVYHTKDLSKPLEEWTQHDTPLNFIEISDLEANVPYVLCVRASTQAGFGKASNNYPFTITTAGPVQTPQPNPEETLTTQDDVSMWIVIGVVIIIILFVLCVICVVCTLRYAKQSREGLQCRSSSSAVHHSNGNGFYRASPAATQPNEHNEEIEFYTPVLSGSSANIPPVETSTTHLDTKGGYPTAHLNGTRAPLLGNGRVPNGHIHRNSTNNSRSDVTLRITENPQCATCGGRTAACRCSQPLLREDDERWADSTQLTNLSA